MLCGYKGKYRHQSYGTDLQEIEIPVILIMYWLEEDEFPEMSDEPAEVFRIKELREKQTADAETKKRVKDRAYGFRALIGFEQQIIGRQHEARYD